eukprot:4330620-Alexandrium_andersonii.AAC.1
MDSCKMPPRVIRTAGASPALHEVLTRPAPRPRSPHSVPLARAANSGEAGKLPSRSPRCHSTAQDQALP